jgi:hypothetical protein
MKRPITDRVSGIQLVGSFSGETRENPTTDIEVVDRDSVNYSYLGALGFKKFCKNLLAIAFHGCLTLGNAVRRSGLDRPAHKLVEVIISRLDAELVSVRSFLPPGILLWRFDPEVVALNNAINLVNQAQTETRPCSCCYCAGAPFYASKKPVASVGLAKAKAAGL